MIIGRGARRVPHEHARGHQPDLPMDEHEHTPIDNRSDRGSRRWLTVVSRGCDEQHCRIQIPLKLFLQRLRLRVFHAQAIQTKHV